jgi:hypothetical protein
MPPVRTRRWTRTEYDRLVEVGVLGRDDRVELLDGLLVVREPQGTRHVTAVLRTRLALERAFGPGFHARPQAPVALDDTSEPEPDVAIVRGRISDYWILNLVDRVLEVYRGPVRSPTGRWTYRRVRLLRPSASIPPLAAPKARVRVADLLP